MYMRATRRGEVLPAFVQNLKKYPDFGEKHALTTFANGLNFLLFQIRLLVKYLGKQSIV